MSQPGADRLRVLMIGPVPRIYGGISAVTGAILDSDLPSRCRLTYLAEGTRQGPLSKLQRFVSALWRACGQLFTDQVDVLHLHVGGGSSFYRHALYLALGRVAGVPVLFHWHLPADTSVTAGAAAGGEAPASQVWSIYTSGNALQRRLIRWALRTASCVVVLSESWRPAVLQIMDEQGAAAEARVVALPNPVDCATIMPPEAPSDNGRPTVLFLGDFSERKGVRDLLAAVPAVLAQQPEARFVVCGGEPPVDVKIQAVALDGTVSFPGFVRGADKLRLLQQAALLALPSYAEGVSIAMLEAMAAGLPVVTTPVGGTPDVIQDGRNGFLVPPGDVPALAAAISRLLADADLRQRMGATNRQQALAEFDLPIYAERLLKLYRAVA